MPKSLSEHRASPTSTTAPFSSRQSPTQFSLNEADCYTLIHDSIFQVKTPYALVHNYPYHDYAKKLEIFHECQTTLNANLRKIDNLSKNYQENCHYLTKYELHINKSSFHLFLLTQASKLNLFMLLLELNPEELLEYVKATKIEFYENILQAITSVEEKDALINKLECKDSVKSMQEIERFKITKQKMEQENQAILAAITMLETRNEQLKIKLDEIETQATSFENGLLEDPDFFKTPRFNSLKQLLRSSTQVARFFSDESYEEDTWGQYSDIDDIKTSKTVIDAHGMRFYGKDRFQAITRATLYETFTGMENSIWRIKDLQPMHSDGFHP